MTTLSGCTHWIQIASCSWLLFSFGPILHESFLVLVSTLGVPLIPFKCFLALHIFEMKLLGYSLSDPLNSILKCIDELGRGLYQCMVRSYGSSSLYSCLSDGRICNLRVLIYHGNQLFHLLVICCCEKHRVNLMFFLLSEQCILTSQLLFFHLLEFFILQLLLFYVRKWFLFLLDISPNFGN